MKQVPGVALLAVTVLLLCGVDGAAQTSPAGRTLREQLEAIVNVPPPREFESAEGRAAVRAYGMRGNRATRFLDTIGSGPQAREAARWLLQRMRQEPGFTFYQAGGMAVLVLLDAARRGPLTAEERQALRAIAGIDWSVPALAEVTLLEDQLRGQPEPARLAAYEKLLASDSAHIRSAFLTLFEYQVPPSLRQHWEGGPRFQQTGRPSYAGLAPEYYYRFRAMRFPSVAEELRFLYSRILAHYERLAREPQLPPVEEELRREEARAAAARLIDMGEAVVPFLLAQREFILRAGDPDDVRSQHADIYEVWIMRALALPEFIPLLEALARSPSEKVRQRALDALNYVRAGNPVPFKAHYIYQLVAPVGF